MKSKNIYIYNHLRNQVRSHPIVMIRRKVLAHGQEINVKKAILHPNLLVHIFSEALSIPTIEIHQPLVFSQSNSSCHNILSDQYLETAQQTGKHEVSAALMQYKIHEWRYFCIPNLSLSIRTINAHRSMKYFSAWCMYTLQGCTQSYNGHESILRNLQKDNHIYSHIWEYWQQDIEF